MATYVVPYREGGKTRLGDPHLADAMMFDVVAACKAAGADDVLVVRDGGGQGPAVAAALARLRGPITIVNADLPCATGDELAALTAAAPALVAAPDGTTNAVALRDAGHFVPLYGAGSAERYEQTLAARRLELDGLVNDVDTWDDLERVRDRAGRHTRGYLGVLLPAAGAQLETSTGRSARAGRRNSASSVAPVASGYDRDAASLPCTAHRDPTGA